MKNETTYTSPVTGLTYTVAHTDTGGWVRYDILLDGKRVQFALSPEGIAASVQFFEVGDGVWGSRFD